MIKKQTIEYKIVSIIGLAGEIQTEEIYKLRYGKEYIRKTISKLITKKCIKVYKFDNKKYLRLTVACKSTYWKIILKDLKAYLKVQTEPIKYETKNTDEQGITDLESF